MCAYGRLLDRLVCARLRSVRARRIGHPSSPRSQMEYPEVERARRRCARSGHNVGSPPSRPILARCKHSESSIGLESLYSSLHSPGTAGSSGSLSMHLGSSSNQTHLSSCLGRRAYSYLQTAMLRPSTSRSAPTLAAALAGRLILRNRPVRSCSTWLVDRRRRAIPARPR